MEERYKVLSAKRASILYNSLEKMQEDLSPWKININEDLKKAYIDLEKAFSNVLDVEAKYRVGM